MNNLNLIKDLPMTRLDKRIKMIGDLVPNENFDLALSIQNELLDYKADLDDFYQAVSVLKKQMETSKNYTDEYIAETIDSILDENPPSLEITINSDGGSASDGFAIIDIIEELKDVYKVVVNTHAIGSCLSMAVAVYMAGDVRTSGENTLFMLHQLSGGVRGSQNKLESKITEMNIMTRQYKRMFKDAKIPEGALDRILSHDVDFYFDLDQARDWGIVNDQILEQNEQEIK